MSKGLRSSMLPVAQQGAFVAGRVTAHARVTPAFLICGAQRCGTTSMYQALRQHPGVRRPVARKGVHYFDDVNYVKGMDWYRAHFPLRRTAVGALAFESSPYYLFHPAAPGRIAADLPEVKVLTLLRDPVERAYSAYTHERARGFETETFERALELEPSRLVGAQERLVADPTFAHHAHRHQAYATRGRYIDQVERLVAALGRERVHVIDAEDFFTDPATVWNDVLRFLGLPDADAPTFAQHNARPRSGMSDAARSVLEKQFEDSDARLEQWWGKQPSWRR